MANKIEQLAFSIGDEIAKKQGVFLVHCEYVREKGQYFLRLFVDKDGGIGIDDCEEFSRAFSDSIDLIDPIDQEYILEVSSPGAQRQLKTEREFLHYVGREVDVKLFAPKDGKKEFSGVLTGFSDGTAQIDADGEIYQIPVKEAVYIKLMFRF